MGVLGITLEKFLNWCILMHFGAIYWLTTFKSFCHDDEGQATPKAIRVPALRRPFANLILMTDSLLKV